MLSLLVFLLIFEPCFGLHCYPDDDQSIRLKHWGEKREGGEGERGD